MSCYECSISCDVYSMILWCIFKIPWYIFENLWCIIYILWCVSYNFLMYIQNLLMYILYLWCMFFILWCILLNLVMGISLPLGLRLKKTFFQEYWCIENSMSYHCMTKMKNRLLVLILIQLLNKVCTSTSILLAK